MLLGTAHEESYNSECEIKLQYKLPVKNILNSLRQRHYSVKNVQYLRIHLFTEDVTGMHCTTTFWSMTDHIYDGGPI
jgi:hypothetical protein